MLWLAIWIASVPAWAATPEEVAARLADIEPMRAQRIASNPPSVSEAEINKAAQGTVVTGVSSGRAYGAQLIKLPIAVLWSAINDETRHPGYTAVAYSELLQGAPCRNGRRVLQYLPVPVPMVSDRWWIGVLSINGAMIRDSGGSVRELAWRASVDASEITTESGKKIISKAEPIASSNGSWFLVAIDERSTYAEYFVKTDPGAGMPASVASKLAARGGREKIDAHIRFAVEGHPSSPIH